MRMLTQYVPTRISNSVHIWRMCSFGITFTVVSYSAYFVENRNLWNAVLYEVYIKKWLAKWLNIRPPKCQASMESG